jgi:serine/threonine-protein kinase HipA
MAYALMAKDCGVEMMPCTLLEENGRAHFMTKRFDREQNGIKHHIQTWCAMSHVDFNEVHSFSYEQLFETMRVLRLTYPEAEQMFRRMVFNVISRNCDDHTKNFAFMLKKNQRWQLAPAYDMCHAYRPGSIWVSQHALSINGKRTDFNLNDLISVANSMNIKRAKVIINQTNEVVSNWSYYAKQVGVNSKKLNEIGMTHLHIS